MLRIENDAAQADRDLRRAHAEFLAAVDGPPTALPLLVGLARATAGLVTCAVASAAAGGDPADLEPRILR